MKQKFSSKAVVIGIIVACLIPFFLLWMFISLMNSLNHPNG